MADPTRRQIAMMADEVGIIDHAAACRLVRLAFEVSRSARAALAADGPAVPEGREPASVADEPSDEELLATLDKATAAFPPRHPEAEALNAVEYPLALELRKARAVIAADRARWGHQPAPPVAGEVGELVAWLRRQGGKWQVIDRKAGLTRSLVAENFTRAADLLEQRQPAPPAEGAPGPSMEDVAPLISWLTEQACQAADASQPTDAGMLTWAAQVIGERVNEDAPDPPAGEEVAELVAWLRETGDLIQPSHLAEHQKYKRAAELLTQRYPEPVPVAERLPVPEDCDAGGRCWAWDWMAEKWCLCDRTSACHGFDHWLPANALPLPAGEVE